MKNYHYGSILIDILLAFSLAAIFVVSIVESSTAARESFAWAKEKDGLLKVYEVHKNEFSDLMPHQTYSRSYTTPYGDYLIDAAAGWYGNDMIETDITISESNIATSTDTFGSDRNRSLSFIGIRSFPFADDLNSAGTPLCSVDFSDKNIVGSYKLGYDVPTSTPSISIVPITLPIDPLLPLTDMEVRNGVAYISADSSVASDPDLIVADIHDSSNPTIRSTINTGPGVASLSLAGDYVYAAATSAAGQLHIIKLEDTDGGAGPNTLTFLKKYKLLPPFATATEPLGSSIFFNDNKVYLGTEKWDGDEFSIIDVSDPVSPVKLGGLEMGGKVNNIFVRNDLSSNNTTNVDQAGSWQGIGTVSFIASASKNQLTEVDVGDPVHPNIRNIFSPSGWSRQEGKIIDYFEDNLAFGRTSGGYDIVADHEAFTWSDSFPTTSPVGLYDPLTKSPLSMNAPGGAYGILSDRKGKIIATRQINGELQITDPYLSASSTVSYALPVAPQSMTCDGGKIYILAKTAPVMYEVTINE